MNSTEDFIQKDREEAACCADAMIEMVNADHHDLISFNRDIGCRIRDHIERLRREVTQQAATISTLIEGLQDQIKYCSNGSTHISAMKALASIPKERCLDCEACAKHAYSDATTPGFFYDKCEKHRSASIPKEPA